MCKQKAAKGIFSLKTESSKYGIFGRTIPQGTLITKRRNPALGVPIISRYFFL
jgi:hypothetical protein